MTAPERLVFAAFREVESGNKRWLAARKDIKAGT
jgi:hypothetical protein